MNKYLLILFYISLSLSLNALSITNIASGDWYNPNNWDAQRIPSTLDKVTIKSGTSVSVNGPYTDCDSLTINGFLDVGATNLTIGGRELYIDERAIRNTVCIINGGLRIAGDWNHQFKVYGSVKFNTGSTFEMTSGQIMIDGCAFTEALSVTADKALLDVTDVASFSFTGGVLNMFNAHYHPTGLTIKGAKHFYNVSFGNNLTLPNFAQRHTSDFLISEVDKPTFSFVRLAYLPNPNRQNRVVLNDVSIDGNLDMSNGVLVGSGHFKVGGNLLIADNGRIETDIECNGSSQQNITTYFTNTAATIKGNIFINNPNMVKVNLNLDVQDGTIQFIQGKLDVVDKTVYVSRSPLGGSSSRYISTQSNGNLVIRNVSGTTFFPVGTSNDYLPVTLTASSGDFSVAARPLSIGTGLGNFAINSQWDINRLSGTAAADIQVGWNAANENYDFTNNRQNARLYHYNGSIWQPLGAADISSANTIFVKRAQNINEFSTFTVISQAILPLSLKNFGVKLSNNNAYLSWQTANESNNAGFEVEKSFDGLSFSNISFVKGSGTSSDTKSYEFIDTHFVTTSYYRLKQIDFDGHYSYSPVTTLEYKTEKTPIKIYPNPLSNQSILTIEPSQNSQNPLSIVIYDAGGRVVYENTYLNQGTINVPVNNWVKGLYMICLTNGEKVTIDKFVKN